MIDRITVAYQRGRLIPEEAADIFASFDTPDRIREFGQRWAGYGWLLCSNTYPQRGIEQPHRRPGTTARSASYCRRSRGYCGRP